MRIKNLLFLLLAMPLAFAACNETEEPQPQPEQKPTFTLTSDATMEFEAQGGEGTITFVYDFTDVNEAMVNIECTADWVEVADQIQAYAASFTFAVAENETEEAREAVVKATIGDLFFEVTVKQAGKKEAPKTPVFELVSEDVMEFSQEQQLGTIEFKLENPVAGVEVEAKANAAWVSNINVKENTIEFVVAANTGAAREAKITATYGMLEFKVTVKQAEYVAPAPVLEITSTPEAIAAEGGEGVVAYVLENAVEGVELQATADVEWITINSFADGIVAFTVAANETSSLRSGNITLTYGELTATAKVEQLFEGHDPNKQYGTFDITRVVANSVAADTWQLQIWEHNAINGDMYTNIFVKMAEKNVSHISDGTYSISAGSIIAGSNNDYSYYRVNNSSQVEAIIDAELTMAIDKENETAKFSGYFATASVVMEFSWDGAVDGFSYEDIVVLNKYTEWSSFTISKVTSYNDDLRFNVKGTSADGGLTIHLDIFEYIGPNASGTLTAGTYTLGAFRGRPENEYVNNHYAEIGEKYCCAENSKANGQALKSGEVVVEVVDGGWKVSFDVVDRYDQSWVGEGVYKTN